MRPRLLDLFCGAGGAAMGYHDAGFDVVGVDIRPQPRFPFEFHQADALTFDLEGFDAIHASPPCQRFSRSVSIEARKRHPDFIGPIRDRLLDRGGQWVIENVPRAPLRDPITLCGSMFRLEVRRHRLFEMTDPPVFVPPCRHDRYEPRFAPAWNRTTPLRFRPISGGWTGDDDQVADRHAMGVYSAMNGRELSESIPPAYTRWIGSHLIDVLEDRR